MKRIYLVRHCRAAGQEPEAALTAEGERQAELLADFFAETAVDRIVSSPYVRAVASIRPFAQRAGITIETDSRLRERVLSTEELPDWMKKLEKSFADLDAKLPGGESSREAMERGMAVIRECLERPEAAVIVVTHGNLMALILKAFDDRYGYEEWRSLANPDVYVLRVTDGKDDAGETIIRRLWKSCS